MVDNTVVTDLAINRVVDENFSISISHNKRELASFTLHWFCTELLETKGEINNIGVIAFKNLYIN